jgi:inhibitor of cysteine peptidase
MEEWFKASAVARVVLLFVVVLMTGCYPVEVVEIDESNNGGQVELGLGEMLVVRLESNPSTGYQWEIDELEGGVVQQRGEIGFESAVQENPPPGTGGWTILRFEAIGAGESELRLIYHQPWIEEEPLVVYTVQVVVTES